MRQVFLSVLISMALLGPALAQADKASCCATEKTQVSQSASCCSSQKSAKAKSAESCCASKKMVNKDCSLENCGWFSAKSNCKACGMTALR